jgi:hypothetical protein
MTAEETDIKKLRTISSRRSRITIFMALPLLLVFLGCAVSNFLISARYADRAGMTMSEIVDGCLAGFSISKQYSGAYLKALAFFENGVFLVIFSVYGALMVTLALKRQSWSARILKYLEERKS